MVSVIKVQAAPQNLANQINTLITAGGTIYAVRKTMFRSVYLIEYLEGALAPQFLTDENGDFILNEDGSKIILE